MVVSLKCYLETDLKGWLLVFGWKVIECCLIYAG